MLQAFRLNDTCGCITISISVTQSKDLRLWNLHCLLNCLGGRYLASQYRWHVGSWDDLDHFYHNLSQSAPGSDGLGCTQFVQQCAINRALVDILCRHTVHHREEPAQWLPQSQLWIFDKLLEMHCDRHFHDLFTWLTLYPKHLFLNCLHLRLIVWTQSPKIIILALMCSFSSFPDLLTSSIF